MRPPKGQLYQPFESRNTLLDAVRPNKVATTTTVAATGKSIFLFCFCFGTIRCLFVWYYEKMQSFCAHTQVLRDKRKQVFHDLKFQDDWSNNNIAVAWARTLFSYSDRF